MKKTLIRLIATLLIVCFSTVLFACGSGSDGDGPTTPSACEHDYQVIEDRPHNKPNEYGTVVLECTKCEDSYEQKYFGHSIKGCKQGDSLTEMPDLNECYFCHDIENHTCPCGVVCDFNVIYGLVNSKKNVAIKSAYTYLVKGEAKGYFSPSTSTTPTIPVATIYGGKIVTKVEDSALIRTAYYRGIFYFPGLVETIGDYVLDNHNVMDGVWIPKTVKEIGKKAFYSSDRMNIIKYEGTCLEFEQIVKGSNWNSGIASGCKLEASDGTITIPIN